MKYEIMTPSRKKILKQKFILTLYCSPMDADMFLEELNRSKDFYSDWFTFYRKLGTCDANVKILKEEFDGATISDIKKAIDKVVERFDNEEMERNNIVHNMLSNCLEAIETKKEGNNKLQTFIQKVKEELEIEVATKKNS